MKRLGQRGASFQVGLLAAIAAAVGIYLIATTVLVAKDGLFYIDQARKLAGDLPGKPEVHLLGFPLMIASLRWILRALGMGGGMNTWIVSAQAAALLTRVLCLLPVYLIGKRFVGRRRSIIGVFILIVLPLPAEWGADALRDFPSLLLLLSSLALLIAGTESGRIWLFALAGLACGLGVGIREELLQLVLYAMLWFAWRFITAGNWTDRRKQAASFLVFMVMVSLPVALHVCASGGHLPAKTASLLHTLSGTEPSAPAGTGTPVAVNEELSVSDASYRIVRMLGGNFHEYFYPFWAVGLVCCLRKKGNTTAKFFIAAMMIGTLALLYLRYFRHDGGLSKRYLLPLSAGTIFFIPEGLRRVGLWIERLVRTRNETLSRAMRSKVRISTILLLLGIAACLPKLVQPIRWEKRYYLQAANRVGEVIEPDENVWAFDKRIYLYADRWEGSKSICEVTILPGDPQANRQRDRKPGWKIVDTFKSTRASDRKYILVRKLENVP
ncbi:MAG: glycosyltransferase family 39 protein [Phycisphaerae bacterium]|jgi:hypothetical protein|nr:glycosyltransferase family 39 protein [Phycisphaerae bacterium]